MSTTPDFGTVVHEPTGKAFGRVTMAATVAAIVPTLVTVGVIVLAFAVGIVTAETAAALLIGALVTGGLIAPSVFTTGKLTPTDQVRTVTHIESETPTDDLTDGLSAEYMNVVNSLPEGTGMPPVKVPDAALSGRHVAVEEFPGGGVVSAPDGGSSAVDATAADDAPLVVADDPDRA